MILVSAIMPTRDRRDWAEQALNCFMSQTYPDKELIIYDDINDPSFPEFAAEWPITEPVLFLNDGDGTCKLIYEVHGDIQSIAQKRNQCCQLARGDIVIHWDSDDWSDPKRMADQVQRLEESGKSVTAYNRILFYEPASDRWGRWVLYSDQAFGTSLCYLKSWWTAHRFDERRNIGEDNLFIHEARAESIIVDGHSMIVARVHSDNTSPKDMDNCRPLDPTLIPEGFPGA